MKVLIVEDAPAVRTRLAALVGEIPGVRVVLAAGGANEALILGRALHPELVVLDLHLPGRSGFDVLSWLKADRATAPFVIVLTNDATEQHRRDCLARGADEFLDKSTDLDRFIEIVTSRVSAGKA